MAKIKKKKKLICTQHIDSLRPFLPSSRSLVNSPLPQMFWARIYNTSRKYNRRSNVYNYQSTVPTSLSFSPAVTNYKFDKSKQCVGTMTVEIDFLQKKNVDSNPYDSDKMAAEFIQHFNSQAFTTGQQVPGCAVTERRRKDLGDSFMVWSFHIVKLTFSLHLCVSLSLSVFLLSWCLVSVPICLV